jgi:hypothetical protein
LATETIEQVCDGLLKLLQAEPESNTTLFEWHLRPLFEGLKVVHEEHARSLAGAAELARNPVISHEALLKVVAERDEAKRHVSGLTAEIARALTGRFPARTAARPADLDQWVHVFCHAACVYLFIRTEEPEAVGRYMKDAGPTAAASSLQGHLKSPSQTPFPRETYVSFVLGLRRSLCETWDGLARSYDELQALCVN